MSKATCKFVIGFNVRYIISALHCCADAIYKKRRFHSIPFACFLQKRSILGMMRDREERTKQESKCNGQIIPYLLQCPHSIIHSLQIPLDLEILCGQTLGWAAGMSKSIRDMIKKKILIFLSFCRLNQAELSIPMSSATFLFLSRIREKYINQDFYICLHSVCETHS